MWSEGKKLNEKRSLSYSATQVIIKKPEKRVEAVTLALSVQTVYHWAVLNHLELVNCEFYLYQLNYEYTKWIT